MKITEEVTREIQEKYESGKFNQQELADWYGVSRGKIRKIINLPKTWIIRKKKSWVRTLKNAENSSSISFAKAPKIKEENKMEYYKDITIQSKSKDA